MTTDPIRDALAELVALEDIKRSMARLAARPDYLDRPEDVAAYDEFSRHYSERRPTAWSAARAALSIANGSNSVTAAQLPENIRAGDPYNDPGFEQLAREYGVWGKADSALCATFWRAGKAQPPSGPGADTISGAPHRIFPVTDASTPGILRQYAEGRLSHLGNGLCPDSVEGYDTRDPDCPVCIALGITSTLPSALRADEGDKQW